MLDGMKQNYEEIKNERSLIVHYLRPNNAVF